MEKAKVGEVSTQEVVMCNVCNSIAAGKRGVLSEIASNNKEDIRVRRRFSIGGAQRVGGGWEVLRGSRE